MIVDPLRSRIMRAVKSKHTKPEIVVRKTVHALGHRFRLHSSKLPGSPDLVFAGKRKVIFVHGCFWHGHDCARGSRLPKENAHYWVEKVERNRLRDAKNLANLRSMKWDVLIVWECELRNMPILRVRLKEFLE